MEQSGETKSNPEVPKLSRQQVVDSLKQLATQGISNPADLPFEKQEVHDANILLDEWTRQALETAKANPEPSAMIEFDVSRSTIFTDAGFNDPDYLDEVANDWLAQDLQSAEDAGLAETAQKIQAKINEINSKIPPQLT